MRMCGIFIFFNFDLIGCKIIVLEGFFKPSLTRSIDFEFSWSEIFALLHARQILEVDEAYR